jgi:hypothetical protein
MGRGFLPALGAASLILSSSPAFAGVIVNGTTQNVNDFHLVLEDLCTKFILVSVVPCEIGPATVIPAKGRAPWAGGYDTDSVYDRIGWSGAAIAPGEKLDIGGFDLATFTYQGFKISKAYWTFDDVEIAGGIPEPASWTLLISGFALTGGLLRRRASAPRPIVGRA